MWVWVWFPFLSIYTSSCFRKQQRTGKAHTRSQNCSDFSTPDLELRKLANMWTVQKQLGLLELALKIKLQKPISKPNDFGLMWPVAACGLKNHTFVACCGLTWPKNHAALVVVSSSFLAACLLPAAVGFQGPDCSLHAWQKQLGIFLRRHKALRPLSQ